MRVVGEVCLLISLITTGYGAFLLIYTGRDTSRIRRQVATLVAGVGLLTLTMTMVILAWALVARDFRFEYVTEYASRLLPRHYCLSALWVGQAGSLLLWSWMMGVLAFVLSILPAADSELRDTASGLVLANVCFLVSVMVFAADPMSPSVTTANVGAGMSPLLQHPSMLIHPPVVFLAYAASAVPCALALAALWHGRVPTAWMQMARPWALLAWTLLGVGLLLGAHWAYQELGWGGYWGWDPVENGSLLPWLTGTAFIHSLMAWRYRECLKKSAILLAVITFALCNFATFLTRSGIFSSVHAFSESPIGWMFLALMSTLLVSAIALLIRRGDLLASLPPFNSFLARETLIIASVFLILLLTAVVMAGTLVAPLSKILVGRTVQVGPAFYNNVLAPVALGLLAMTAVVPLLQWGAPPTRAGRNLLALHLILSLVVAAGALILGIRHPIALALTGLAALTILAFATAWLHDSWRRVARFRWRGLIIALQNGRRKYSAYSVHLGIMCVAIGVTGSSLGTQRHELTVSEGDTICWANRQIHFVKLVQRQLPDKLVAEAVLEISRDGAAPFILRPARHLHLLQNEWTTESAILSNWSGDFYTVLNAGLGEGRVALTLVNNPMMRWIWIGGVVTTLGALVAMWPSSRRYQTHADTVVQRGVRAAGTNQYDGQVCAA